MIVPRKVNIDLQTYRAWVHENDVESTVGKRWPSYLNQLTFNSRIEDQKPSGGREGWWDKLLGIFDLDEKETQYQPSSGLSSSAVSATMITGDSCLA